MNRCARVSRNQGDPCASSWIPNEGHAKERRSRVSEVNAPRIAGPLHGDCLNPYKGLVLLCKVLQDPYFRVPWPTRVTANPLKRPKAGVHGRPQPRSGNSHRRLLRMDRRTRAHKGLWQGGRPLRANLDSGQGAWRDLSWRALSGSLVGLPAMLARPEKIRSTGPLRSRWNLAESGSRDSGGCGGLPGPRSVLLLRHFADQSGHR